MHSPVNNKGVLPIFVKYEAYFRCRDIADYIDIYKAVAVRITVNPNAVRLD